MIDQATIDRVLDAAQIVDVVSDFVTLRKRGVNYIGLCPFHNERTPSFSVSPSKGICKCFSCGKGGNAVHFIMEHEQLGYTAAIKWLAKKYNIEIQEREMSDEEKQAQNLRESLFVVNQFANQHFQETLTTQPEGMQIGLTYFRQRGFRDDIIKKFQLGFCLSKGNDLARTALQKGFQQEFLVKTGLCYQKDDGTLRDRFAGRVIFPVHSVSGNVVAFGGRVLNTATKGIQAKYVNSPESEIYSKSRELYGIYFAKQSIVRQDRCFLVEGYTDVISMHQSGIENVVASSGTALTHDQIRLIHRFTNNVTVLYDGDMAGIKASIRGIDMLLEEGLNIKVCLLPDGDDPDSFARKHNATEYQAFINDNEVDFIKFKVNLLMEEAGKDPIKKAGLISSIVQSISVIPDAIIRSVYIKECCQMLGMEEKMLTQEVAKRIAAARESKWKEAERQKQREMREKNASAMPASPEVVPLPSDTSLPPLSEVVPVDAVAPSEDAVAPPPEYVTFIPKVGNENNRFYQIEKLLINHIIRHGEKTVCLVEEEDGSERPISVIEYIVESLKQDELQLVSDLHQSILNEGMRMVEQDGFTAERYFINHVNPEISKLAVECISDRYQLSKIYTKDQTVVSDEERLDELTPHLILDYKLAVVEEELKQTLLALAKPEIANDDVRSTEIMKHFMEIKETHAHLSKEAGDRVITT